jgi:hypothetical protein
MRAGVGRAPPPMYHVEREHTGGGGRYSWQTSPFSSTTRIRARVVEGCVATLEIARGHHPAPIRHLVAAARSNQRALRVQSIALHP